LSGLREYDSNEGDGGACCRHSTVAPLLGALDHRSAQWIDVCDRPFSEESRYARCVHAARDPMENPTA
jgi:hypothetical protein